MTVIKHEDDVQSIIEHTLNRLNDINDDYSKKSLVDDLELDIEVKLKILYKYGKQLDYGQGSAWTDAIELTLDVFGVKVEGVNK